MKQLLFIITLLLPRIAFSQYKASNGITYNVGDTITIGKGSGFNGSFLYIQMNGAVVLSAENPDDLNMNRTYSGLRAVIKEIKVKKIAKQERTCFTTKVGPLNYIIYVEQAIEAGELK